VHEDTSSGEIEYMSRYFGSRQPDINNLLSPFQRFTSQEAFSGILLMICTVIALLWANSTFDDLYHRIWHAHLILGVPKFLLDEPVHFWINDALMAIFFFVVGLEIKRSVFLGELASARSAALPVVAAIGGMVVPAGCYLLFNWSSPDAFKGWAIPMSTDIAFSLGVLALLGTRIPLSLKVFLTAFAIVDDIGAVVVIAVFFTDTISWINLAVGGALLGFLVIANWINVRNPLFYALVGIVIWVSFFQSGIHPTIAGVLIAMVIPLRVEIDPRQFADRARQLITEFEEDGNTGPRRGRSALTTIKQRAVLEELEEASKEVESPLQRLEHLLHPWVALLIMPLFALSNAGVDLGKDVIDILMSQVSIGIFLGLVVGKPLGVVIFSWLAIKSGFANMPEQTNWWHILGAAWLGGIGFTMSIFVTGLAFEGTEVLIAQAKTSILVASLIAGLAGYLTLRTKSSPES